MASKGRRRGVRMSREDLVQRVREVALEVGDDFSCECFLKHTGGPRYLIYRYFDTCSGLSNPEAAGVASADRSRGDQRLD